ncbi:MFS general substrate transporter [Dipodascopsis tothii]|uniref:MFS general substrate transporter n=1 Tax=Dipodascopsis tothii TaxID=44089 RepID=UPI0034CF6BE2
MAEDTAPLLRTVTEDTLGSTKSDGDPLGALAPSATASSASSASSGGSAALSAGEQSRTSHESATPLPLRVLWILSFISFAEQTALNSIGPYVTEMMASFEDVRPEHVALYVGLLATCYSAAQFLSGFFWGTLSDFMGRKPVMLFGTVCMAVTFLFFGTSRTATEAIVWQFFMGLLNGNACVVPTVLGEITDKSNQSDTFSYLPVVYGLGAIVGPLLGGIFSASPYTARIAPYFLPNFLAALLLLVDFVLVLFFLEETLAPPEELGSLTQRARSMGHAFREAVAEYKAQDAPKNGAKPPDAPSPAATPKPADTSDTASVRSTASARSSRSGRSIRSILRPSEIVTSQTMCVLGVYAIFTLVLVANNSLLPVFLATPFPSGRGLSPYTIGLVFSIIGFGSIFVQFFFFRWMEHAFGNRTGIRIALVCMAFTLLLTPMTSLLGPSSDTPAFWGIMAVSLLMKIFGVVMGLTFSMLLVTNTAPSKDALGAINGLAQTLAALARATGPTLAGGMFSFWASTGIRGGEILAWAAFSVVAVIGVLLSLGFSGARGASLEESDESDSQAGSRRPSATGSDAASV